MYAWWSNKNRHRYWRIYGGDIELRMQLGGARPQSPFSGHHIGVYASMATYDIQTGNRNGVIGDKFNYAAGICYGYSLPIARRVNLNFAISLGYMWGRYKKHHPLDEHDVWISTHNHHWFGPTRAEVGFSWLIGKGNVNIKKGGTK